MNGIRPEAGSDVAAIRRVRTEACGQSDEAGLVDALRGALPGIRGVVAYRPEFDGL